MKVVGRIAAQTVKQVMIQLIREDERGSIYEEYKDRVGTIVTGTIARFEGGTMIVNLGRVEGIMPRSEQIPGEQHQAGRARAGADPGSARCAQRRQDHPEPHRTRTSSGGCSSAKCPKSASGSSRSRPWPASRAIAPRSPSARSTRKVDAVGACVGVRGSRIKNIVDELGGEKIDIVRWNESSQILIGNALKPAEVAEVSLCFELGRATVVVNDDQLCLAIGKRGQNVRLAARLTGWDIDILTPPEFQAGVQRLDQTLKSIEGITQEMVDKMIALGLIDVRDIEEVGTGPLMEELGLDEATAEEVVERCAEEAKIVAVEQEAKKAADAAAKAADRAAMISARARWRSAAPRRRTPRRLQPAGRGRRGSRATRRRRHVGRVARRAGSDRWRVAPEIATHRRQGDGRAMRAVARGAGDLRDRCDTGGDRSTRNLPTRMPRPPRWPKAALEPPAASSIRASVSGDRSMRRLFRQIEGSV